MANPVTEGQLSKLCYICTVEYYIIIENYAAESYLLAQKYIDYARLKQYWGQHLLDAGRRHWTEQSIPQSLQSAHPGLTLDPCSINPFC